MPDFSVVFFSFWALCDGVGVFLVVLILMNISRTALQNVCLWLKCWSQRETIVGAF